MKTFSDEEIQALLDARHLEKETAIPNIELEELELYRAVYTALEKDEPEIPLGFANKVAVEVFYKEERKKVLANRLLSIGLIVLLVVVSLLSIQILGVSLNLQSIELLKSPIFHFIVSIALLVFIAAMLEPLLGKKELKREVRSGLPFY